jgi:histidinol-phosphate aminotransferase
MLRYSRLVGALPAVVPFVPPEALERRVGRPIEIRIGANESAFGPSPKAVAAIAQGAHRINWYCDPEGHELREALARHHGVLRENIGLGIGADDILGLTVRATIDPGDPVVMSHGAYPTFAFHVAGFGGRFITPPYRDFRNDAAALADAAEKSQARLVYLSNPDNPTGSWLDAAEQLAILAKLPTGALLVLDEAYSDFAPPGSLPEIDPEDERVLRVRTFSKAHGMAGARVGYAVAAKKLIRISSPRWCGRSPKDGAITRCWPRRSGSRLCRPRPISLRSISAMAVAPARPSPRCSKTRPCSCACRASRRSTGLSG